MIHRVPTSQVGQRDDSLPEVLVVLPTYNERDNLEHVVESVRRLGHAVLIVDDASPDGTGDVADRLAGADPGVKVVHRERKLGLGSACEEAFRIGLAGGAELFVEMDADRSHRAEDLNAIVDAARASGGMAIGSRYVSGAQVMGLPLRRRLLSWGANAYCRSVLGLGIHDYTSAFRCYTRDLLGNIGLQGIISQGYSFQIEIVYRANRLGYPIVERPIQFTNRVFGSSKVSRDEIGRAFWTVLRLSRSRYGLSKRPQPRL